MNRKNNGFLLFSSISEEHISLRIPHEAFSPAISWGSLPLVWAFSNLGHLIKSSKIFKVIFKNGLQGDFNNQISDFSVKIL